MANLEPQAESEDLLYTKISPEEAERLKGEQDLYAPLNENEINDAISSFMGPLYRGLGLGDYRAEVAGAIESPVGAFKALVGADEDQDKRRYIQMRDQAETEMQEAEGRNPLTNVVGETLGMGLGTYGGAKLAGGAKTGIEALLKSLGVSYGAGAVANPGNKQGEAGGIQAAERFLSNGPTAAIIGSVPAVGGSALSGIIGKAEKRITKTAGEEAAEAAKDAAANGLPYLRGDQVNEAGKLLDVPIAPGMASNDQTVRGFADAIRQSPTFAGRAMQRAYDQTFGALRRSAAEIMKDRIETSHAEMGDAVKEKMRTLFTERYAPIKKLYAQAGADLQAIKIEPKVRDAVLNGLRRRFRNNGNVMGTGQALAQSYDDLISKAPNLAAIRQIQSDAKKLLGSRDPAQFAVGQEVVDSLEGMMQRTVTRKAIEATGKDQVGRKLAAMTLNDIKTANKEYKKLIEVVQTLGGRGKMKGARTFGDLMKALSDDISNDQVRSEDIGKFLFDTSDRDLMRFVAKEMPDAFEMMRRARIGDIMEASKVRYKGGTGGEELLGESIDVTNFLKQIDKLTPEAFQILFPNSGRKIDAMKTLAQAMPQKMGPSGTPQGILFNDYFNAAKQIPKEIADHYAAGAVMENRMPIPKSESIAKITGMIGGGLGMGAASALGGSFQKQEMLEGYPVSLLRPVPIDLMPEHLFRISQDPKLTVIEKARLSNLANKHGLAPANK